MAQNRYSRRHTLKLIGGSLAATLTAPDISRAIEPQFPAGAIIRTILKDLPPSALAGGPTLFHEHLSHSYSMSIKISDENRKIREDISRRAGQSPIPPTGAQARPAAEPYALEGLAIMVADIRATKKDGIACIVDGGHPDTDASIDFLKQLSMRTGMPIVASAGYYFGPFYPPDVATLSEDEIAERFIRQVNVEPRGAFGEIGSSNEITQEERKVFRAIGKAHLATNLPIYTHTAPGALEAQQQLDLFESMGVNPKRVAIGHMGTVTTPDITVHTALCKRGAFIAFDRQGGNNDTLNSQMVLKLLDAGFADQLLFSSDYPGNSALLKRNGGPGWSRTVTAWLPKLRAAGVKKEVLHGIMVNNSRRFLAFVPKTQIDERRRNFRASDGRSR